MSVDEELEKKVTEEVKKRLQEEEDRKLKEENARREIEEQVEKRLQDEADRKRQEEEDAQRKIKEQVEKRLQEEKTLRESVDKAEKSLRETVKKEVQEEAKTNLQKEAINMFKAEPKNSESEPLRSLSKWCAVFGKVLCGLACLYFVLSLIWPAKFGFSDAKIVYIILFIASLIFSLLFIHISKAISIAAEERGLEYQKQMCFLVFSEMITDSAKKDELYQIAALSLLDTDDTV